MDNSVKCFREDRWTWQCIECKQVNDVYDQEDPDVECDHCGQVFNAEFVD